MFKQRKQYIKFLVSFCLVLLFGILFFSFSDQVSAQADTFGVATIDENVALGNQSLTQTVVKIINIALGLLGTIALGIVLYGGFIYMTSGGNEEKVGQAKKILVNGTIGLAIILSAWTITYFVLQKLGEATGAAGMGGDAVSSRCRDAVFAQENPDICFPEADFNGGNELECALQHRSVLLVRGITPTSGDAKAPTGMNNAKIRVLFNNPVSENQAAQVFDIYKIENGQEVTTTASFVMQFVDSDPALVDAVYRAADGSDRLPKGEYVVKVNKSLKTLAGNPLVEEVSCGNYPANAKFVVDTDGVVDAQPPQIGPIQLNGKPMNAQGDEYPRGKMYNYAFTAIDNSGIGLVQFHVTIRRNGEALPAFDLYDIPKISAGSKSTNENPFIAHLPLSVPANANLFDEYTIDVTVFDIDGNTSVTQIRGIVIGANCQPGDQSEECLNQNRSCSSDLQCPSRKCLNNQCVEWPVIVDINPRSGIWDGAEGNFITIVGRYFGEEAGNVEFGFEKDGRIEWVLANSPACGGRDLWHDDSIVVMVPGFGGDDEVARAVVRVTKVRGAAEAVDFADTTTDNHGPIPGPNQGRFIKNASKRPGLCSVVVASGNENIVEGATEAPINTAIIATGNAFGNEIGTGRIDFGTTQAEVTGWSNDSISTRIPANLQPGVTYVGVTQNNFQSNDVPFTVVGTVNENRPEIISIDPVTTTPKSFVTIFGKNFGNTVGEVFLAPTADTNCRPGGVLNRNCLQVNLQTCGESAWTDTQIIGQVPGDAVVKKYFVIVERSGDRVVSQGSSSVGIENGSALPGICYFSPTSGPAPLPANHVGLKFRGINFSDNPKLYFSNNKSNPSDVVGTWLVSQGGDIHKVNAESNAVVTTITSTIPVSAVDGSTLTPNSQSTIKLRNAEGQFSNSVTYTVNDCQNSPAINGFQCCSEGPEKGFFKPNGFLCAGQAREGGYVWRFTTGKIPEIPHVIERCEEGIFPSPAPWKNWLAPNEEACINQNVVVAFSLPQGARLEGMTDPNKVKLFTCEENDSGAPDCSGNRKRQVVLQKELGDLALEAGSNLIILDNPFRGQSRFLPETWYHVEISKDIESIRMVNIAGTETEERQKLLVSKPCSNDTAYCFDFKTGSQQNRCELVRAGVLPNPFRVEYLGVLQLPGRFDAAHLLNPPEENILYYNVWGAGSQNCSVLDVRGLGWQWTPEENGENSEKAIAERKIDSDTHAQVTSIQNTVPETVPIRASVSNDSGQLIMGQSDLTIDLGAPSIIDFWPSCTDSCIEAEMGARFSRQMMKSTLVAANITLMKCNNELCEDGNGVIVPVELSVRDYESFRFVPSNNQVLVKGAWYKVTLSENILGLGKLGIGEDGQPDESNDQPGKAIDSFSWRFRTTDKPDGKCVADKVVIEPRNFVARSIGERTQYNSQPRTAPNKCSRLGQNLNPWMYGWDWKTVLPQTSNLFVAGREVARISQYEVQGKIKPFCGITCMPNGSNISTEYNGNYPLCGNGIIDAGEDCDIAQAVELQSVGVSCSLNCLRPGNRNRGADVTVKQCGDGVVNTDVGEECDPRDLAHGGAFCNETCLWVGGVSQVESTTGTPWCGSGNVVSGKDCDINNNATTTPAGKLGCSTQCLHLGTRLASSWCQVHKDDVVQQGQKVSELAECQTSVTVCGNSRLELGEECEYVREGSENVMYVSLAEGVNPVRIVTSSAFACNDRCLLGNVCTLNQIPLHPEGPRCQKGTPGCSDGCHIVGSSVTYPNPSFCGDTRVGTGEHLMCENRNVAVAQRIGQTPVQMVTAIGNGELNEQTKSQNADILAGITKKRDENNVIADSPEKPIGRETYALQCGFSETLQSYQGDLLLERDGNMERVDIGAWEVRPFNGESLTGEKVSEAIVVHAGSRSLHVQGSSGVLYQRGLPVEAGKTYRMKFFYKVNTGNIWAFPFTKSFDTPDNFLQNMQNELDTYVYHVADEKIPQNLWDQWIPYERVFVAPNKENLQQTFGISIRFSEENPGNRVDFYIDDFTFEEVVPLLEESKNDCPNNDNNGTGVGTSSCCYPRPNKVTTYPEQGATDVCQNTVISFDVNDYIEKSSLENNIMLVSEQGVNTQCGVGEKDVTEEMLLIRRVNVALNQPVGFFGKVWNGVKEFFAGIFGVEDAVADVRTKWCGSTTSFVSNVSYQNNDNETISTISIALKNSLLKNTKYNVVFFGGKNGLKNYRGVGLNSAELVASKYTLYDYFEFETGSHICKIESISVDPSKYLFVKPNTTSTFVANIVSNNKSQRIQPIPNVYSWEMSWMPARNPLFEIPVEGMASDVGTVDIKSKNLEGTLMAAAIAHIDVDVSNEDNQTGRAFSSSFELTTDFCENPWPPRQYFPYEDGVSFGSFRNNDATWNNGVFEGNENIGVEVTNLPNRGENRVGSKAYFNFSFSYCADANVVGNTSDDLPYLKPIVFGNFIGGNCVDQSGELMHKPGNQPANNRNLLPLNNQPQGLFDNTLIGCTFDFQCQQVDKQAHCRNSNVVSNNTLTEGVWKKFLFVNDKNDDAIGLQIMQNSKDLQTREPVRRTAREWYQAQFPGENLANLRDMTIAGYDAVFDGKSYYVNALNQNGDATSNIYNNIYIFSINSNAQADTKKVFEQIMTSLKFNINVSDMGYCLATNANSSGALNQHQTLLDNLGRLSEITDQSCQTDFDCRSENGLALSGTNGVCSNAKTKLLRDWKRLGDVKVAQRKLEVYRQSDQHPNYPLLDSGTFIPGYTNSMWGSWNLFGSSIGGSLVDPINKWSTCGDFDPQTCWNAASSTLHCPMYASITEYEKTADGYQLHIPFEYFSLATPLNPVISEIIGNDNISKLTTEPWCQSDATIQAQQGMCGNGIINTGEECDSRGVIERVSQGSFSQEYGKCRVTGSQCLNLSDCPIALKIPKELITEAVPNNKVVIGIRTVESEGYCTERNNDKNVELVPIPNAFEGNQNAIYRRMYGCRTDRDCSNALNGVGPGSSCVKFEEDDLFDVLNSDIAIKNLTCIGGSPAGIRDCAHGSSAPRMCNDQCRFEYGMCTGGSVCGNGKLEAGEICDSGALNGTYGRCAGRASIQGHPEMECMAYHPQFCGNGSVDRGQNNSVIEACDYIGENNVVGKWTDRLRVRFQLSGLGKFKSNLEKGLYGNVSPEALINPEVSKILNPDAVVGRCQHDVSLLCVENDDCIAPSKNKVFDIFLTERLTEQQFEVVDINDPNSVNNFGPCIAPFDVKVGSPYSFKNEFSCVTSCSSIGGYCGDGTTNAPYESCDDRNIVAGDGCSQYCQVEVGAAGANQPGPVLACGNGRVEVGETCDMGGDNGKVCVPSQYGRSCSYCSADCKNVLTVDPLAFCGDNKIDLTGGEKCDIIRDQQNPQGIVTLASSTPASPNIRFAETKSCPENYRGEYSCNNSCQDVANTCIQCGRDRRGTVLALSVLNPMVSTPLLVNGRWGVENRLGLYVKKDVKNVDRPAGTPNPLVNFASIDVFPQTEGNASDGVGPFRRVGGQDRNINAYYLQEIEQSPSMADILSDNHVYYTQLLGNDGLVSSNLCKTDYGFVMNAGEQEDSLSGRSGWDVGQHLMGDTADFFPLDFSKAGLRVESELVFSPAVPTNTIRVVLRAEKEVGAEETQFVGVIKNTGFTGAREVDYMRAISVPVGGANVQNQICDRVIASGDARDDSRMHYWLPNCPDFKFKNSIFVHEKQNGPLSNIQSMTIDMNGGENNVNHKAYSYYVKAINGKDGSIPMGQLTGKKVFVDIYVYHEGQIPKYSIYKPAYTFALSEAVAMSGNSFAEFWHVFNLVYVNGNYEIQPPTNAQGQSYSRGKLATCDTDIACYVPGEVCHLEGCL